MKLTSCVQIAEVFAPSEDAVSAIKSWLSENGIHENQAQVSKGMNWVRFNATISEVESLLQTEYKIFNHEVTGKSVLGCDEYSIPTALRVSPYFHSFDVSRQPAHSS